MESPVKESQCNGRMERPIQTLQGQIRTILVNVQLETGITVNPKSAIYPYLVNWACTIISRYKVNHNGKTPFQMLTGRQCTRPITAFGSPVVWKKSLKNQEKMKGETDWNAGMFLGVRWRTSEAMIATDEKVVLCRTIQNDPAKRFPTEKMISMIPETLVEFLYSGKEDEIVNEDVESEHDKDREDKEDEEDVANLFGDFSNNEPNDDEDAAHSQGEDDNPPEPTSPSQKNHINLRSQMGW